MRARVIYSIISLGIAAGCIAGIVVAAKEIVANRYLSHALYKLCADVLQKSLNTWTGAGLAVSLCLVMVCLLYNRCASALRKEGHRESGPPKTAVARSSFPYAAALVPPFLMVLFAANLLPALLDPDGYRPPVIVISMDDLRADHVGCYGYERNTTPVIDSLAGGGIIFQNCYVPEPWTLTSHMSMLTSLYPITHGVTMTRALPPAMVTLAEVLSNKGYYTMGFMSGGPWTNPYYGFGQGFDAYISLEPEKGAEYQNAAVKQQLEQHRGKPLFVFIHYFDVHSDSAMLPYDSPPPFNNLFSGWYSGGFKGGEGNVVASQYLEYLNKKQTPLSEDDLNYIISLYDNGIAYTDKCLGDLLARLKDMGLFDEALIVVTADHGEEFREHGYLSHGSNPYYYEESVRVPLIIKFPQASGEGAWRGKAVGSLAESIDIMPTILDFLGLAGPEMEGRSLRGVVSGKEKGKEYVFGLGTMRGLFVRSGQWKLVSDSGLKAGRIKLFDLHADPTERVDLAGKGLEAEERLKGKLAKKIKESQALRNKLLKGERTGDEKIAGGDVRLTPEDREKLKALGYLQ